MTGMEGCKESKKTRALAASGVATFDEHLPEGPISALYFENTGANNGAAGTGIDKYELSLDSKNIFQALTGIMLRALLEPLYTREGGKVYAAADLSWELDFSLFGHILPPTVENGKRRRATVGLPGDTHKIWNTYLNGSGSAGVGKIGYELADQEPDWIPYLNPVTFSDLQDGAHNDQEHTFKLNPLLCVGLVMEMGATEVTRVRWDWADKNRHRLGEVTDLSRSRILAKLKPYSVLDVADPVFIPFDYARVVEHGSVMTLDTGADFLKSMKYLPVMFKANPRGAVAAAAMAEVKGAKAPA